jgi:hypothetical protein
LNPKRTNRWSSFNFSVLEKKPLLVHGVKRQFMVPDGRFMAVNDSSWGHTQRISYEDDGRSCSETAGETCGRVD